MELINKFLKFCQTNFEYGWIDQNGIKHIGINDGNNYYLQSPEELLKCKIGICWDRTELYRYFFQNKTNLKIETYYLLYDDKMGCPSHTILVYYYNDKVYWFEPMFQSKECYYSGIHEYENIELLLFDFKKILIKYAINNRIIPKKYNNNNIFIYKYDKPNYHINGFQMRNHIDNSILMK